MVLRCIGRGARSRLGRAAAIGLALSTACGRTGPSAPLAAIRIELANGAAPTGAAGQPLAEPIAVRVFGSDEQPLPGAPVTFSAAGGGSVDPATATADRSGLASTRWTLGPTAGPQQLTATAESGVSTTITATATAGRPAAVTAIAGNNQSSPAGTAVPTPPSVRVADAHGNLVANAPVTFTVLSGGGHVTGGLRQTNAQGVATVGSWVLGPTGGTQTLAARVEESGVSNNPVVFTATATAPTGATMVAVAGDNQVAPVGRLVPVPPQVVVRSAAGTPVAGVTVTFEVTSGGGAVVGGRQVTDASGTATVGGWFLGLLPGINTLSASATGLPSVTFTATGQAGVAVVMVAVSATTQSAPAGTMVSDPPSVLVRDAAGLPVAGVVVTFAVTAGGGSVAGSPVTTNASGIATLTSWTLGVTAGPNTVTATATGLPSVTFNATGTPGVPTSVTATAGTNQTAVQGTAVLERPTVRVNDANNNPASGVVVTFAVGQGGGSATGLNQVTDVLGVATVGSWTLGPGTPNTLIATVSGTGITGNPVTFTAQSATQIAITGAPNSAPLGMDFNITAQLRNSAGAAVALAGVPLTITKASGPGMLEGTLVVNTGAAGSATFTIRVTGPTGNHTFTVSGTGLTPATTNQINITP